MIKIQDVLDFIGSKRPQYSMENWRNIKRIFPIKDENGNLGYYNNKNLKEGYWEYYWRTGNLWKKGNYVDGKEDGYWERHYINGEFDYKGSYVNGKEDGYWEFFWDNGELKSKGNHINGEQDGYWENYLYNGKLSSKGNYVDGKEEGEWFLKKNNEFFELVYFEEGKIVHDIKEKGLKVYYDDNFVKYYYYSGYYFKPFIDNSGNELGYINDNDKLDGKWEGFFSDNSLILKVNFVNGVLDGDFEKYYRNGNLRLKGNYVNGNQEGLWLTDSTSESSIYLQAVIIKNNEIVKNIEEKGFEVYYDDKFIKYYKINYDFYTPKIDNSGNELGYLNDNGFQEGKWKIYNNKGFLESEGNYINGKYDGEWKFYYYNKLVSISTFKNGKFISYENF